MVPICTRYKVLTHEEIPEKAGKKRKQDLFQAQISTRIDCLGIKTNHVNRGLPKQSKKEQIFSTTDLYVRKLLKQEPK